VETAQANVTGKKPTARRAPAGSPLPPARADAPKARRIPDACRAIGISRSMLYKLAGQGKVKLVRIAGRTVVPETEIDRLTTEGAA
jgi:hypothetical protein